MTNKNLYFEIELIRSKLDSLISKLDDAVIVNNKQSKAAAKLKFASDELLKAMDNLR